MQISPLVLREFDYENSSSAVEGGEGGECVCKEGSFDSECAIWKKKILFKNPGPDCLQAYIIQAVCINSKER